MLLRHALALALVLATTVAAHAASPAMHAARPVAMPIMAKPTAMHSPAPSTRHPSPVMRRMRLAPRPAVAVPFATALQTIHELPPADRAAAVKPYLVASAATLRATEVLALVREVPRYLRDELAFDFALSQLRRLTPLDLGILMNAVSPRTAGTLSDLRDPAIARLYE